MIPGRQPVVLTRASAAATAHIVRIAAVLTAADRPCRWIGKGKP